MSEEETQEKPRPKWEKRTLKANENMKKVCEAAAKATEAEINSLRRKLKKLQYGG